MKDQKTTQDIIISCSHCGKVIGEGEAVFVPRGEVTLTTPLFCRRMCELLFNPDVLTQALLGSMINRMNHLHKRKDTTDAPAPVVQVPGEIT